MQHNAGSSTMPWPWNQPVKKYLQWRPLMDSCFFILAEQLQKMALERYNSVKVSLGEFITSDDVCLISLRCIFSLSLKTRFGRNFLINTELRDNIVDEIPWVWTGRGRESKYPHRQRWGRNCTNLSDVSRNNVEKQTGKNEDQN